ncbi:MAG: chorismate synthase, partial [Deltaproteobacteria bacterium]|nr:chorismate synthase [Deltaproteobacteria bacterium]
SIAKEQKTIDLKGRPRTIRVGGRHDISAIPRIVPVILAMVRLTLADFLLRQRAITWP